MRPPCSVTLQTPRSVCVSIHAAKVQFGYCNCQHDKYKHKTHYWEAHEFEKCIPRCLRATECRYVAHSLLQVTLSVSLLDGTTAGGKKTSAFKGLLNKVKSRAQPAKAAVARGPGAAAATAATCSRVAVTYHFKAGVRRFRLVDTFTIRGGKIQRLLRQR